MNPYYDHGGITLYHARCEDVLAVLPPASVDLVFTSPPYNLGNTTGGGMPEKIRMGHYAETARFSARGGGRTTKGKWGGGALANGYADYDDNMPHAEYVAWQQTILRACWPLLTASGAIYYNHKPRILDGQWISPIDYIPEELRPYIRQVVIWARAGGVNFSPAFYLPTHEWIVIIARQAFRLRSKGASGVGDVWYVPQEANPNHPAPFPLALPLRAIETTGAQTILDPFVGSGTALRAAKDLGRVATGIDRNESYCQLAVRNLQQEAAPLSVVAKAEQSVMALEGAA